MKKKPVMKTVKPAKKKVVTKGAAKKAAGLKTVKPTGRRGKKS